MAEFEDKLNAILGDPEAMGQIVSIAKALSGGGDPEAGAAPPQEPGEAEAQGPPAPPQEAGQVPSPGPSQDAPGQDGPDLSALLHMLGGLAGGGEGADGGPLSALGGLDPRILQTAMTLFSAYSASDNRKAALLAALKPFVREERYAKMDKAIQIAKLSRVIRVAFQLFRQEGGGRDV